MKVGAEFQYLGLLQKKKACFLMKDACQLCPNPQKLPPPTKKNKKERTIRKNKNQSQKKHAIKTLKVNTTTTGNSEHGHEPSSNCLQPHSAAAAAAAAPPESQPKGGYLNSVTDQSPPTLLYRFG
jgi:hypothetical protein